MPSTSPPSALDSQSSRSHSTSTGRVSFTVGVHAVIFFTSGKADGESNGSTSGVKLLVSCYIFITNRLYGYSSSLRRLYASLPCILRRAVKRPVQVGRRTQIFL